MNAPMLPQTVFAESLGQMYYDAICGVRFELEYPVVRLDVVLNHGLNPKFTS